MRLLILIFEYILINSLYSVRNFQYFFALNVIFLPNENFYSKSTIKEDDIYKSSVLTGKVAGG